MKWSQWICVVGLVWMANAGVAQTPHPSVSKFQEEFERALADDDLEHADNLVERHPTRARELFLNYVRGWVPARHPELPSRDPDLAEQILEQARLVGESFDTMLEAPGLLETADAMASWSDEEFTRWVQSQSHYHRGSSLNSRGSTDLAIQEFVTSAELAEELSFYPGAWDATASVTTLLQRIGQYERAIPWGERSLAHAEHLGDPMMTARAAGELGAAYRYTNQLEQGLVYFHQAVDLRDQLTQPETLHPYLYGLGECYLYTYRYHEALRYHDESRRIREVHGTPENRAFSSQKTGNLLLIVGRPIEALEMIDRALEMFEQLGATTQIFNTLLAKGSCHEALGQLEPAIECFERIVEGESSENLRHRATSNLSVCYHSLGDYERALQYAKTAYEHAKAVDDPVLLAASCKGLSIAYFRLNRLDEATEFGQEAVDLFLEMGDDRGAGVMLTNLGVYQNRQGRPEEALRYYERARTHYENVGSAALLMTWCANTAEIMRQLGRMDDALERMEQAFEISRGKVGPDRYARLHTNMADFLRTAGRHPEAIAHLTRASAYLGDVSVRSFTDEQQAQFREKWRHLPISASKSALSLSGDPDAVAAAFAVTESHRARTLVGRRTEQAEAVANEADPELQQQRQALIRSIEDARVLLGAEDSQLPPDELGQLHAELESGVQELERITQQMRRENPALMELIVPASATLQEVQQALAHDQVLVAFVLNQEASFAWVITGEAARVVTIPGQEEIRDLQVALKDSLGSDPKDPLAFVRPARELHECLLGDIEELEQAQELILVPDAFLAHVPFEALLTRDPTPEEATDLASLPYLVRTHAVRYTPSASFLHYERAHASEKTQWSKDALLLADPVYSRERVATREDAGRTRALLGPQDFERLTGTRDEVTAIAEALIGDEELKLFRDLRDLPRSGTVSGARFDLFVGDDVNESRLRGDLTGYRILHVAAHGHFDPEYPWFSGLVLSPSTDGEGDTGFLSLLELGTLSLDAQLVFLSACETARGEVLRFEGLQSTARSFLIAGARSVVATQWKVRDDVAAALASSFYESLFDGVATAEALRRAKLAVIERGHRGVQAAGDVAGRGGATNLHAHPSLWAAFVLYGGAE